MRKLRASTLLLIILMVSVKMAKAQQTGIFSQYYLNMPSQNPAFTGIDPFLDVKAGFRQSWNDFANKNNAYYVTANGSVGEKSGYVLKNNALRVSDESFTPSQSARRHHGLGGMALSQTIGAFKYLRLNINYAYHLPVSDNLNLALGTRIAYSSHEIDYSGMEVRDQVNDQLYQSLLAVGAGKFQNMLIDFGITMYSDNFYIGVSTVNLVNEDAGSDQVGDIEEEKSYKANIGYAWPLNPNFDLLPSADFTYSDLYGLTWQGTARLRFKEMVYLGFSYENDVRASLLFGLSFEKKYSFHYSYDYFTHDLNDFNKGNHEFAIGIFLFNKYSKNSKFW
ncbi:PorP/SprF family type IX secretion system membrane protein [Fulvivirga sediminis]|uniref:PorP/SprF family type IX secretion system membrane protein n=1 Tax=Fulvivirga sediminis TaxID=2803949 RepID=A0A937FAT4_9BACT|nr:PorP/SprF family type IX secretion system membrane protein [Fulvivirga sediminis]MBL3658177.1 PorP/SprF family type IX secretion system membrane protein [Fulvivirga sediminis]